MLSVVVSTRCMTNWKNKGGGEPLQRIAPPHTAPTYKANRVNIIHYTFLSCKWRMEQNGKETDKSMGKILDAFLDDQLHVNAVTEKRTSHHQYLCEQVEILHNKLAEKLNDEDKALLQKLTDTYFDESCCDAHNYFVRGYRLGVLMTMEVFEGRDSFLGDDE